MMTHVHDVIIIGAGIAGLRCAHQLIHDKDVKDVLVVEAQDHIGGRIRTDTEYIPGFPIEIGAEMLHGANTSLTRLAAQEKWNLREIFTWAQGDGGPTDAAPDGGIGYYYLGDQHRLLAYDDEDPDFCHFNEAVHCLSTIDDIESIPHTKSMLDYFQECNLTESMMKLAKAGYANTAGSTLDDISYRVTCRYERQWVDLEDEGDYRVISTSSRIIKHFEQGVTIVRNWIVRNINYESTDKDVITLTSADGRELCCRRVVVTVPTSVFLKIEYLPPLPIEKVNAVKSFGMRRAAKVLMHFTNAFWPSNTHGVICSDSFLPEFWVNHSLGVGHLVDNGEKVTNEPLETKIQYLVTGFASSECADRLAQFTEQEILEQFLVQLDTIYGTSTQPHPATECFVQGRYFEWANVTHVEGGYSYPRVGQHDTAANDLAAPLDNRVFFAGEATSYEQPGMSIHSAMDTGARAAEEVAASLI